MVPLDNSEPAGKDGKPKRRVHRFEPFSAGAAGGMVWLLAEGLALVIVLLFALLILLDRAEVQMDFAADALAGKLSETLKGQRFEIGSVSLAMARSDGIAGLSAHDVSVLDEAGTVLLTVPLVDVRFTLADLLRGEVRPQRVVISGADVRLKRAANGTFRIALGGDLVPVAAPADTGVRDLNTLVSGTEFLRDVPELAKLTEVSFTGATITYDDQQSGRRWQADGGELTLKSYASGYYARIAGRVDQGGSVPASVEVTAKQNANAGATSIEARFDRALTRDLAGQFEALSWLRVIDAPVSGRVGLVVAGDGHLMALDGGLDAGPGFYAPEGARPVAFTGARARFSYDPATDRFTASELTLQSGVFRLKSEGEVLLERNQAGAISAVVPQLRLSDISLNPEGVFAGPVQFAEGRLTAKVSLDPVSVAIGELTLANGKEQLAARGDFHPGAGGWDWGFDLNASGLDKEAVLRLWPVTAAVKAREWVAANILDGQLDRLTGAVRSGAEHPVFTLQFGFSEATARFLKFMPVAEAASGFGELNENSFTINIMKGDVAVEGKGKVSADGTRIHYPDYRLRPVPAEVDLVAEGGFAAVFDLINRAPLSLLDRAGIAPDIADGKALVRARLEFPIYKGLQMSEIQASAEAELTGVSSDRLAKGHHVAAPALKFVADGKLMTIAGEATLDGTPVTFTWQRAYGPGKGGESRLDGTMLLGQAALAGFGVKLPEDSFSGETTADIGIDLVRGKAPEFTLDADLGPLALTVPALGWTKPAGQAGRVHLTGSLTDPLTLGPFSLSANGLEAEGRLGLTGGKLASADFTRLAAGDWLDAAVSWQEGTTRIVGGMIDLRRLGQRGGSEGGILELAGTDIVATDTIRLTGATGRIVSGARMEGSLQAAINGGTPVSVELSAAAGGQRIVVTGDKAGAILRDAGLFGTATGGTLRLGLTAGAPGSYRGSFDIRDVRVKHAPVLAEILSAASIIGFLEQLDGKGLAFARVSGDFRVADGIITLHDSKAEGASIGITAQGRYQPATRQFDMSGVVSPLYAVNGIFAQLPVVGRLLGGRDGEGLIGFNFTLRGTADDPHVTVNPLSILTPGALRELMEPRQPATGQ